MALTVTIDGNNRTSATKTKDQRKTVTIDMPLTGAWTADIPIFDTATPPTLLPELLESAVLADGATTYFTGHVTNRRVTPWGGIDAGALSVLTCTAGLAIEQQIQVTGTYGRRIRITSCSVANPTVVTTDEAHGFTTGDSVIIADVSGESPSIEGTRTVTVTSATTFTVAVNVTVAGFGGTVRRNLIVKTFLEILEAEYDFASFGITLDGSMADGPLLEEMRFDRATMREVFNRVFDTSSTIIRLTPDSVIEAFQPGDMTAAYVLSNANGNARPPVGFEQALGEKVNRVTVRFGGDVQKEVLEYFTGDGSTTDFLLSYTYRSDRGYVLVASVHTPLNAGVWSIANNTLTATVAPSNGTKIELYYTAQFPGVVTAEDSADITANGGDPEGVWPKVFDEPDTYDFAAAQQLAEGYLAQYTTSPRVIKVTTREDMELPGTEIELDFPNRGFDNTTYLIQHVKGVDVGAGSMEWEFTCVDFIQRRVKFDEGIFLDQRRKRFTHSSIAGETQGTISGQFQTDVVARSSSTGGEAQIGLVQPTGALDSGYGIRMREGTGTTRSEWAIISHLDSDGRSILFQDRGNASPSTDWQLRFGETAIGASDYCLAPQNGSSVALGEDSTGKRFSELFVGSIEATGEIEGEAGFRLTGLITPAQITSNQNNYNPTGLSTAFKLHLSSDASRNITGIVAQADGRFLLLMNIGAQDIVLTHNDTGNSTAANCFRNPSGAAFTLNTGDAVWIHYDTALARWQVIAY